VDSNLTDSQLNCLDSKFERVEIITLIMYLKPQQLKLQVKCNNGRQRT